MIFLGDQHGLQSIESSLLLLVADKHTTFLAVKGPINTGHSSKLDQI